MLNPDLVVRTVKLENCADYAVRTEFTVVFHYCSVATFTIA
jgi:hypothetical protein